MKYILIILLLLSGKLYGQIDPAIAPYVDRFKKECKCRGIVLNKEITVIKFPSFKEDSILQFNKVNPSWAGVTVSDNKGNARMIFFNPVYWYYYDDVTKEMNVFHELFHAHFNFPHIQDDLLCGRMSMININAYRSNRKTILDRIFTYIKLGHYE